MRKSHLIEHLEIAITLSRKEGSELLTYLLKMAQAEARAKQS